jgi:hypothetical protein
LIDLTPTGRPGRVGAESGPKPPRNDSRTGPSLRS